MYRKCATEISAQHQKQITDALLQLLQKIPFEEITVTQLCQAAGVSRRIFYHLFSSKTGALHALVDQRLLAMGEPVPGVQDVVLAFFLYWKDQGAFLDAMCANGFVGLLPERMIENMLREEYDLIYWLRQRGWSREREVLIFSISGSMGLVYDWYHTGFEKSPEEMAQLLRKLITCPLTSPAQME